MTLKSFARRLSLSVKLAASIYMLYMNNFLLAAPPGGSQATSTPPSVASTLTVLDVPWGLPSPCG